MPVEPWRKGTVIRILDETYNTKRYFIKVDELDKFDFKPGQFVTLDLPIHESQFTTIRCADANLLWGKPLNACHKLLYF